MNHPPSIVVSNSILLQPMEPEHASLLFELVDRNRNHLRAWLPWVDGMRSTEQFEQFILGAKTREEDGSEASWLIFYNGDLAGRIGLHYISQHNKHGSIGYWIAQDFEGKGIMTVACKTVVSYGFTKLDLNRIELKCGTENKRSAAVPERLGFTKEGVLRQAELVNGSFIDLYLFSILRSEWVEQNEDEDSDARLHQHGS